MATKMEEAVLKERVAGISGLGMAEELRVKKAIQSLLSANTEQAEDSLRTLQIQAIRAGMAHRRQSVDISIIKGNIEGLRVEGERIAKKIEDLIQVKESCLQRNALFERFNAACEEITKLGPSIPTVNSEIEALNSEIEAIERATMTAREELQNRYADLGAIFESLK